MGRKPVITKEFIGTFNNLGSRQLINADFTSEVINVAQTDKLSIHLTWASGASPNIDIYVQARNGDDHQDTFRNLDFGTPIQITTASGEHELILTAMPFTDLRLFFDVASGSAQVDATFTAKSDGN